MPTNLKDRTVNGLFGSKVSSHFPLIRVEQIVIRQATELFAKFPMNCFINSGRIFRSNESIISFSCECIELDRRRVKHLASSIQDLLLTEMKYDDAK